MNFMLVKNPDMLYAKEIAAYREEMLAAESSMDGCGSLRRHSNPQDWIAYNKLLSDAATIPEGRVVSSQFVLTDETGRIYGMLQVRHELNDYLRNFAGHIGYSVRPSERRKGYAKKMLSMALEFCREELHLPCVMVSCLVENEASRRTILSCGGVYEEKVYEHVEGVWLEKYWIHLGDQ